jgi:hypothetical protein
MAVAQYTFTHTIHRTTQNKQYVEQHKNFGRERAVPHLCGFYPGICRTSEEKAPKNLNQESGDDNSDDDMMVMMIMILILIIISKSDHKSSESVTYSTY